ncbi:histidine phosphatase family protein [Mucilaginibacter sp.]|uniref:histidine phosphatase family protein n=1 Tax=Mucilaginibacter sp. TaxID=1882438 RepID=UPI003D0FE2ED
MINSPYKIVLFCLLTLLVAFNGNCQVTTATNVRIVFIRHGEKPAKGDNLSCQGINRSLLLPAVLVARFGIPAYTYVPALGQGYVTKHSRMYQTVVPLVAKYNLSINTSHAEKDSLLMADELRSKQGTVLVVWEHNGIAPIVRSLGITDTGLVWPDEDYDSIWIVAIKDGKATFTKDKEGLTPSAECKF